MFTLKEIDAIRFYQGDIRKRDKNGQISEDEKEEGFYGTPSAYRTMNCLMFDGTINEENRIAEGNGKLAPELFLEIEKVIEVYCDIYRAMCKSVIGLDGTKKCLVYRTDRGASVKELKKGYTISFTSTSKKDEPEEFLCKKVDLTLLNFVVPLKVPHLDFQEVLGEDYLFEKQEEILLPPFMEIVFEELELTEKEKQYRDANNSPPYAKYLVLVKGIRRYNPEAVSRERKDLTLERNQKSMEILKKMIDKEMLTEIEQKEYCQWKKDVRAIIWREFQIIEQKYLKEEIEEKTEERTEQRELLMADVKKTLQNYNDKRKKYKKRIRIYNIALITANTIPLACMALSFVEAIQIIMKIAAVITSMISIFLSQMIKTEVYDMKLMQRSKTYLKLHDLNREMKYESMWDKEKEEKYIKKFRDIMKEDTTMCLQNLQTQAKTREKFYQDDIRINI